MHYLFVHNRHIYSSSSQQPGTTLLLILPPFPRTIGSKVLLQKVREVLEGMEERPIHQDICAERHNSTRYPLIPPPDRQSSISRIEPRHIEGQKPKTPAQRQQLLGLIVDVYRLRRASRIDEARSRRRLQRSAASTKVVRGRCPGPAS